MWADQTDILSANFAGTGTTHKATLLHLVPNTKYHYVISVHDASGDFWYKKGGTFITQRKVLDITFEKIKVIDDSDELSGGDLVFAFYVNGDIDPAGTQLVYGGNIDSGATKSIKLSTSLQDPPDNLKLNVTGFDDDETEFVPLGPFVISVLSTCGQGAISQKERSGDNDCGEFTGKSESFSETASGSDADAAITRTFKLAAYPTETNSELKFEVTGKFTVTYQ